MNFDPSEAPPPPKIDPAAFDRLKAALASGGSAAAIEKLIAELRAAEDFNSLFYAMLLKKRVELGVSPFPTGPSADLPPHTHEPYEQAIRESARHVGNLYLNRKCTGALVGVHPFGGFNMSGTDSKAGGHDYLGLFMQAKVSSAKVAAHEDARAEKRATI